MADSETRAPETMTEADAAPPVEFSRMQGPAPQPAAPQAGPAQPAAGAPAPQPQAAAFSVKEIAAGAGAAAVRAFHACRSNPRRSVQAIESLLDWTRRIAPPETFEKVSSWGAAYGHAAIVAAQVLCLVFGLFAAIRLASGSILVKGIGGAALLVILQYTADKFLNAGESLIKACPSRLASTAFLDCLSVLTEIFGVLVFLGSLVRAAGPEPWTVVLQGFAVWALTDAVAYVALQPSLVNTTVSGDMRAGEEAIGILSFLLKAVLKIVPIAFGIGAVIGCVGLLLSTLSVLINADARSGEKAFFIVMGCACLPFFSYVLFVFYHLAIDVLQAILSIPRERGAPAERQDGSR